MKIFDQAQILNIPQHGNNEFGYLSIFEKVSIPNFSVRRVYWTSAIPEGTVRGNHAHKECVQILFCVHGTIEVQTITPDKIEKKFILSESNQGIILWPHVWHTMKYSKDAVQLVLASQPYEESDYLRNFDHFLKHYLQNI